jgi:AraC family transcriptional regulator of adaptative response/methylated-DNA-[protein]-cysteine methyltransferase
VVQKLVQAVEENPEKRWRDYDFRELSVDASTARRQFKKRFGMTFVEYARARRMGLAMKQIRSGGAVIDAQISAGYESGSGFRDAFSRFMGAPPSKSGNSTILKASWIDTELGPMVAIADNEALYLLEFVDRRGLEREVERLRLKTKAAIVPGETEPIRSIRHELDLYFSGRLEQFQTPVHMIGSDFQKSVWEELMKISAGSTASYSGIASLLGRPQAYRAVARANGTNQLAIIIPCHRVIKANGDLCGYAGGLARKEWLINHEKQMKAVCQIK